MTYLTQFPPLKKGDRGGFEVANPSQPPFYKGRGLLHGAILFLAMLASAPIPAYDNIQLAFTLLPPTTSHSFVPQGVAVDRTGRIWVTDVQNNCVVVYSSAG